jgi:hypothetical protein
MSTAYHYPDPSGKTCSRIVGLALSDLVDTKE